MFPAENEQEHFSMMIDILGMPSKDVIFRGERWKNFFNRDGSHKIKFREMFVKANKKSLRAIIKTEDSNFISFIEVKLLEMS